MCSRSYIKRYGNHKPICGGTIMYLSVGKSNLAPLTLLMIVVPTVLWFVFSSQDAREELSILVPLLMGTLSVLSIVFMFLAMLTEPGILPTVSYEVAGDQHTQSSLRNHYNLVQFRAKFSSYTDNCIECFDHYCPWVGNAVGRRNYHFFIYFLWSCFGLSCTVLGSTTYHIVKELINGKHLLDILKKAYGAILVDVFALILFLGILGLCGFHMQAIAQNFTTNEHLKYVYNINNPNPYDQGCWRNFKYFFKCKAPRSRISVENHRTPLLVEASIGPPVDIHDDPDIESSGNVILSV